MAIVAAVAVVLGGVFWYNSSSQAEQARLEEQRTEQAAQDTRDAERASEAQADREAEEQAAREAERAGEDEAEVTDLAAREADDAEASRAEGAALEEAGVADDDRTMAGDERIVVGDEITDGALVVESATDGPVFLEPNSAVTSARNIGDAETADFVATTDPEQLLTPENFDRGQVLALIDDSEQLTAEQRSTLRALTEGASANPETLETAIASIRASLDLPPLN